MGVFVGVEVAGTTVTLGVGTVAAGDAGAEEHAARLNRKITRNVRDIGKLYQPLADDEKLSKPTYKKVVPMNSSEPLSYIYSDELNILENKDGDPDQHIHHTK